MILRIDQASSDPIYLQIRGQIIAAIARGELRPGDGLPSVRALASDLGVNLHTVNKAYAVLRDEGYLLMRGRSGAFVAEPMHEASPARASIAAGKIAAQLQELAFEHKAAGGEQEAFLEEARRAVSLAFDDPGVTGAKRDIRMHGVNMQGESLKGNRLEADGRETSAAAAH